MVEKDRVSGGKTRHCFGGFASEIALHTNGSGFTLGKVANEIWPGVSAFW